MLPIKSLNLIGPHHKSGTDQRITLQKLTLYNAASRHVQHHPELIIEHPNKMEKAIPGPSNVREAKDYKTKLDELFEEFMTMLRNDDKDALETTIKMSKGTSKGHGLI